MAMRTVKVKATSRRTKSGKRVSVRAHNRATDYQALASGEHGDQYERLMAAKKRLQQHHPGDDNPLQGFDGYTVSDARRQIDNKINKIRDIYTDKNIKHEQNMKRWRAGKAKRQEKQREHNKAVKEGTADMPQYKAAKKGNFMYQMYLDSKPKRHINSVFRNEERAAKYKKQLDKHVAKHGFGSMSKMMKYYQAANQKVKSIKGNKKFKERTKGVDLDKFRKEMLS